MYLGIEIGGTKLQLGIGPGDGTFNGFWRGPINVELGASGIRRQIVDTVPLVLANGQRQIEELKGIGIGFGGPVDDHRRCVIKSHQIHGWDNFPLATWLEEQFRLPVALGNDADVAGLAEAHFGAGKNCNPVFYITIGSGLGGGLIIDGKIVRGVGLGAAEIGHLRMRTTDGYSTLEDLCSGWGIEQRIGISVPQLAEGYRQGDAKARSILNEGWSRLADALCHVIALICPQRIIIGGGVSLLGEDVLFQPLRELVAKRVFRPFAGSTEIVPASLREEVVVHGALLLARVQDKSSRPLGK
jgi:glucokinase